MAILEKNNLTVMRKKNLIPELPFLHIKEALLGKSYNLTIVFCSPEESRMRNRTYRGKDYATNILSFPLSHNEGEIYISLFTARREAHTFDMSYRKFLHLLIIHGCLHLKGHDHGSTMEKLENKYLHTFYS